jgi:hypothetical protein
MFTWLHHCPKKRKNTISCGHVFRWNDTTHFNCVSKSVPLNRIWRTKHNLTLMGPKSTWHTLL